ncbi:MAG: signal peptide peptidase SppA [Caldilineaceae bacterium]
MLRSPALTLAQAQSLAAMFMRFRQMNARQPQQLVAFIEETNAAGYVAACAADRIYMTPLSEWNIVGLRVGGLYLKDALQRIGVAFDVVRVAPWKTAGDMFHDAAMSDESRAQFNWLLDSLFEDIVTAISQGRKLSKQAVGDLIDRAPLSAAQALAADLIDGLAYEDELPLLLGRDAQPATLKPYDKVKRLLWRTLRKPGRGAIGVISLEGAIMMGKSRHLPFPLPLLGGQQMGHETVQQQIRDARQNDWLDAVVLHIDSPGGSALASDLMWREIDLLGQEKPLIVYMGNVAASGGYYIAAPGAKIVAQSATLTGSIGVINMKPITESALQKVSVQREFLQRGANADILGEDKHWDAEQLCQMNESVQHIYREFKERVAAGRQLDYAQLDPICNGRVWTGAQAQTHGLVDALGDIHTAIGLACAEAGLNRDEVRVINMSTPKDKLPAEPLADVAEALGVRTLAQAQKMLLDIAQGNWRALYGRERFWLLADNLPQIEG